MSLVLLSLSIISFIIIYLFGKYSSNNWDNIQSSQTVIMMMNYKHSSGFWLVNNNDLYIKGIVYPNIKHFSSFTRPHVILAVYDFLFIIWTQSELNNITTLSMNHLNMDWRSFVIRCWCLDDIFTILKCSLIFISLMKLLMDRVDIRSDVCVLLDQLYEDKLRVSEAPESASIHPS